MEKHSILWMVVPTIAGVLWIPDPVGAYLDPGTTGSIFAWLAPVIVIFAGLLGLLLRPVRVLVLRTFTTFFGFIHGKLLGEPRAESPASNGQPVLGDSPDDKKSGESTNEHSQG